MGFRLFFLLCGLPLLGVPAAAQEPAGHATETLGAVSNAYRANLEAFACLSCRYTVTRGFAASVDDALAGRLAPNARTATATLFKRGAEVLYRLNDDEDKKTKAGAKSKTGDYMSINGMKVGMTPASMTSDELQSRGHRLSFVPGNRVVNVSERERDRSPGLLYILDPLNINTAKDFGALADRAMTGEIRADVSRPSPNRVLAAFGLPKNVRFQYTLDMAQGALPVRIDGLFDKGNDGVLTVVVSKVRVCSKGRFFPERITMVLKQSPTFSHAIVHEYVVTELDVDNCPPADALKLDLPAGTSVVNGTDSRKFFKTSRPEAVTPDQLAQILEMTEKAPDTPQMDTAIPPPPRTPWWWYAIAVVAAVALAVYGLRRVRRAWRADVEA